MMRIRSVQTFLLGTALLTLPVLSGCGGKDKDETPPIHVSDAGVLVSDAGISGQDDGGTDPGSDGGLIVTDGGQRPHPQRECEDDLGCDVDMGEICDLSIHECVTADCATMTCTNGGVCTMEEGYGWCNCPHGFANLGQNCLEIYAMPEWFGVQWADPWQNEADRTNNVPLQFELGQTQNTTIYGQVYWPGKTNVGNVKPDGWKMQLGLTTASKVSYPVVASQFEWYDMKFNEQCSECGNNLEWNLPFPTKTEGTFKWILRFSANDSDWVYGDVTPGFITSASNKPGEATVSKAGSNQAEWTFMVYLDGDNSLGYDDYYMSLCREGYFGDLTEEECYLISDPAAMDLAEMQEGLENAGESSDKINVIVLFDDNASAPALGTKLYKVTRSGLVTLNSGSVFSGSEANMADVDTLKKFGVWAVKNYPAKKYALVLWDHGGGWRDGKSGRKHCGGKVGLLNNAPKKVGFRDFSQDETNGGSQMITLANGDYGKALKAISSQAKKKLDLVGFDACLMGMFEVAAATKDYADYLVASSETEPGAGWPYNDFIETLGKKPTMAAQELATNITNDYVAYYKTSGAEGDVTTMAAYDLSTMGDLTNKLNAFGNALLDAVTTDDASSQKKYINKIQDISLSVQRFTYADHADLGHFAQKISNATSLPQNLRDKAKAVSDQLANTTIIAHGANNASKDASGMAIFLPQQFNCCADEYGSGYTVSTWDELDECYTDPYSSTDCTEGGGGAMYNLSDVVSFQQSDGKMYTGPYYAAGWSSGWNDFLNTYYWLFFK